MAKSGMKSKERRLRSTTSLRALGPWSAGERNQSVWSWTDSRSNNNQHHRALHEKKNQKKTQSASTASKVLKGKKKTKKKLF